MIYADEHFNEIMQGLKLAEDDIRRIHPEITHPVDFGRLQKSFLNLLDHYRTAIHCLHSMTELQYYLEARIKKLEQEDG